MSEPTLAERKQRKIMATNFVSSQFYKEHLEPYIRDRIAQYRNLNAVTGETDMELLMNLKKNKATLGMWQGLLNIINKWVEEGGETDGGQK